MIAKNVFTRRKMLATLGVGTTAFMLRDLIGARPAKADVGGQTKGPFLVFCYFSGGWDTLLSLDPRSHKANLAGIDTAYDQVNDKRVQAVLQKTNGTGIVKPEGSNIAFGPAVGKLSSLHQDLCVVRGMNMETLTHEVGRRYFLTGKFPRGLAASGSSLSTVVANAGVQEAAIPNLVMGVETYNEGLSPAANGLVIRGVEDLAGMLKPLEPGALTPEIANRIRDYVDAERCLDRRLDGTELVTSYQMSREKAAILGSGSLWSHFDFNADPSPQIQKLYDAFDIQSAADLAGAKGQTAIAAQAITKGISQAVSIQLAKGIDTHDDDWESEHAGPLIDGFDSLANLINFLKNQPFSGGGTYWDQTIVVAFSEFARTPKRNARGGRDHHLASACLVAGKGIKGNTVIGGTTNEKYAGRQIDLATGKPVDNGGVKIRPADVHATVLEAIDFSHEHISNQNPNIIQAMLKKG